MKLREQTPLKIYFKGIQAVLEKVQGKLPSSKIES